LTQDNTTVNVQSSDRNGITCAVNVFCWYPGRLCVNALTIARDAAAKAGRVITLDDLRRVGLPILAELSLQAPK
jgi:hypothetical protein